MTNRSMALERDNQPDAPGYHAFLLRLWCDGNEAWWHASLQAPGDPERRGFADLESLMKYLQHLCPSSDSSVHSPNNS